MMSEQITYFAYGSNMPIERISVRVSSAKTLGVAVLHGHTLKFHKVSKKDGSAKCDAFQTSDPTDKIYGALFSISADELSKLDEAEGYKKGYDRKEITVIDVESGRTINALAYIATNINAELLPYTWYKEHVLRGAKQHNLPTDYIEKINSILAIEDSDKKREKEQLAIYN